MHDAQAPCLICGVQVPLSMSEWVKMKLPAAVCDKCNASFPREIMPVIYAIRGQMSFMSLQLAEQSNQIASLTRRLTDLEKSHDDLQHALGEDPKED